MQNKRPLSVSTIAWFLIVRAVVACAYVFLVDLEVSALSGTLYAAGVILQLVVAVGMLNRMNWARTLYLLVTPISIAVEVVLEYRVFGHLLGGTSMNAIFYIVIAILLKRRNTVSWFTTEESTLERQKRLFK